MKRHLLHVAVPSHRDQRLEPAVCVPGLAAFLLASVFFLAGAFLIGVFVSAFRLFDMSSSRQAKPTRISRTGGPWRAPRPLVLSVKCEAG